MNGPFRHFPFSQGELGAQGVRLAALAATHGTPLYVYSDEAFLEPLRALQKGLRAIDPLICFAVKANPNIAILKMLGKFGAGMDLVSEGELRRALHAGVRPGKIVFSGVGKGAAEIREALNRDLHSFNVESVEELGLISRLALEAGKRPAVALRFNPDVDPKTHPYISTGLKKNKFGLNRAEILKIARAHAEYPGVRIAGVSIHIGSQILSLSPFNDAFARLTDLAARLEKILPHGLEFLDLGGGLGIAYRNEKPPAIAAYCKLVLRHFGPKKGRKNYRILLEPGRTIAGNAGVLISEVLYRKERGRKDFVVLDAAMNDLLRPALYGSYHEIVPLSRAAARGKRKPTDLVGPVCESSDCFASDRPFPAAIGAGDLVAILSAGAYGMSMASNYNTRGRPAEVLIEGGKPRLIRRREGFEDQIRAEEDSV